MSEVERNRAAPAHGESTNAVRLPPLPATSSLRAASVSQPPTQ